MFHLIEGKYFNIKYFQIPRGFPRHHTVSGPPPSNVKPDSKYGLDNFEVSADEPIGRRRYNSSDGVVRRRRNSGSSVSSGNSGIEEIQMNDYTHDGPSIQYSTNTGDFKHIEKGMKNSFFECK